MGRSPRVGFLVGDGESGAIEEAYAKVLRIIGTHDPPVVNDAVTIRHDVLLERSLD